MIKGLFAGKFFNFLVIGSVFLMSSCSVTKKVPYFQDINAINQSELSDGAVFHELTIQTDDILSISMITIDPQVLCLLISWPDKV